MERDFLVNVDNETKRSKVSKILTFLPTDRSLKKILTSNNKTFVLFAGFRNSVSIYNLSGR